MVSIMMSSQTMMDNQKTLSLTSSEMDSTKGKFTGWGTVLEIQLVGASTVLIFSLPSLLLHYNLIHQQELTHSVVRQVSPSDGMQSMITWVLMVRESLVIESIWQQSSVFTLWFMTARSIVMCSPNWPKGCRLVNCSSLRFQLTTLMVKDLLQMSCKLTHV